MAQSISQSLLQSVRQSLGGLTKIEEHILRRFEDRSHVSRDTNLEFDQSLTPGQRLADAIARFGGSWLFIAIFACLLGSWIALNSLLSKPFDPFPYILLNLFLSMLAAIQAPIILMSQSRLAAKDRLDASHDYEVNLKAELEVMALHEKIDSLRQTQWEELIAQQRDQLAILRAIETRLASFQPSGVG